MAMRTYRIIIAALIGLSVAMLPAASSFAMGGAAAAEISASHTIPDCDHHRSAPNGPTENTADDCPCLAACAFNSINLTTPGVHGVVFPAPASAALKPARASIPYSSLTSIPPFRPPRI
jgi:hypothetical protein